MRRLFGLVLVPSLVGCSNAMRNNQDPAPQEGVVIFRVYNANQHAHYAKVHITDRYCNEAGARYIGIVSSGENQTFLLRATDFNPGGFAVWIVLPDGVVSGMDVVKKGCTVSRSSPRPGDRVSLDIPPSLRHLNDQELIVN